MTDRDRLRELAEKATPGPWVPDFIEPVEDDYPETGWFREGPGQIDVGDYNTLSGNDAAYIAAASPDVILALLEERRVLRDLLGEAINVVHQTESIRDHADPTDTTGWHVKGIETCADLLCVESLAALQAEPAQAEEGAS